MSKLVKLVRPFPEVPGGNTEAEFPEEVVAEVLKNGWTIAKESSKPDVKQDKEPEVKSEVKPEVKSEVKPEKTGKKG